MDRTKKIIISLSLALIILVIVNYIMISYTNSKYIEIPVFKEDMLKGRAVTTKNITYIQVKNTAENKLLLKSAMTDVFQNGVLTQDVSKGEWVVAEKLTLETDISELDKNFSYISIPISELSYPTCAKLNRGDKVDIYYTAKSKDISNAIKDKQRLYSNSEKEGLVTCLLFENIEVISVHDNTGKETKDNIVTDVLIRLNKQDAILVANLKSQGFFDIVLN